MNYLKQLCQCMFDCRGSTTLDPPQLWYHGEAISSNVLDCTAVKVAISQEQQKRNQVKSCSLLGPHV